MPQDISEMKRKLRELKKLEIKIRSSNSPLDTYYRHSANVQESDLIWKKFFDLKNEATTDAKYSIKTLLDMTKDEFKEAVTEYISFIYYSIYKGSKYSDDSMIDIDILTELGLPIYADPLEIKRKLRELAKTYHPDNGGDSHKFIDIMEKYNNLKK